MSNPLRDALNKARNYDPTGTIDSAEVKAITNTLSRVEGALLGVADNNDTRNTLAILQVIELLLGDLLKSLDPPTARRLLADYNNGQEIHAGVDPEVARKAALYDQVTDEANPDSLSHQLKMMKATANGRGTLQLGGGSGSDPATEVVVDKIRPLVTGANADRVDGLIDLITKVGELDATAYAERAAIAFLIMEGGSDLRLGNWVMVDGPNGTGRMPQVLATAYETNNQLRQERDNAVASLNNERDKNTKGSLAQRLEMAEQVLKDEKDEKVAGSLAHQLAQVKAAASPTHMVDKTEVKKRVDTARTKLDQVSGLMGSKPRGVEETRNVLNDLADLVK